MRAARNLMFAGMTASLLAACASGGFSGGTPSADIAPAASATGATAGGGYALSPDEKEFDCKRLTGKIQIRILELRTYAGEAQSSALARSLQAAGSPILGGTSAGIDPQGEHAQKIAQINAYNHELQSKNCRSFDLALALTSSDLPPNPTVAPLPKP